MADTLTPPVTWYQRADYINFKIHVDAAKNLNFNVTSEGVTFSSENGEGKKYACEFKFFANVKADTQKHAVRPTEVEFVVKKEEEKWWDRFTSSSTPRYIKVDWSHWKDEDELDGEPDMGAMNFPGMGGMGGMPGMGGMGGFPGMGGMGGMPGMGGMDFSNMDFSQFAGEGGDEDDEDDSPPPLE